MRARKGGIARVLLPWLVILAPPVPGREAQGADPAWPVAGAGREIVRGNWGAGRCSSTSCHGSPAPVYGSRVFRNEHTVWASRDPHANAYQTLQTDWSRSIAKKLGQGSGRIIPAHQDGRCLACHSTPGPAVKPELASTIRQDGVGCESCHGGSERWLGLHTTYDWDVLSPADKDTHYGLVRLDDLSRRAERCIGCHVGVPASGGLPAREVDHDLIAAGHPRLSFEFSSFLANLPAHWVETGRNTAADFPARTWVLGQVASGRTALDLLQGRARAAAHAGPDRPSSWPEFSEYDCAGCHQDLRAQAGSKLGTAAARPGLPVWGTWYFPLVSTLAERSPEPDRTAVGACLNRLRTLMNEPMPDAGKVATEAGQAAQALDRWLGRAQQESFDPPQADALFRTLRTKGSGQAEFAGPGWDLEAQVYLGLVPLRQSMDPVSRNDPRLLDELRGRRQRLLTPFAPIRAEAVGGLRPLDGAPGH